MCCLLPASCQGIYTGVLLCCTFNGKKKEVNRAYSCVCCRYACLTPHPLLPPPPPLSTATRPNAYCVLTGGLPACLPAQILAFRWAYFKDPWNRFDFFIVLGSSLGILTQWFLGSRYGSIATIIRIFRIGRVLRLVRGLESMAQLFRTLLMTLPSLGNVGALLFLLFFIYAAMGVQLYAKVRRGGGGGGGDNG